MAAAQDSKFRIKNVNLIIVIYEKTKTMPSAFQEINYMQQFKSQLFHSTNKALINFLGRKFNWPGTKVVKFIDEVIGVYLPTKYGLSPEKLGVLLCFLAYNKTSIPVSFIQRYYQAHYTHPKSSVEAKKMF